LIFLNRRDLVGRMAEIVFEGVTKRYPGGHLAVRDLTLAIGEGEFLVLVGPSGCGKSTALRMVAGLEDISEGRILIGGQVANDLSPRERNIAMVFQSYALYPHLTVAENIGFGLRVRGVAKDEIGKKVRAVADALELEALLDRKPQQLSGGQRQRVAMGRAIVREPAAFLMDEPLSNLDARLRVQTRTEIARIQKLSGVTTIYVTHDQVEAMTMGDRVAVLNHGDLQQLGTPRVLYHEPANLFVASFIGSPAMNFLEARLVSDHAGPALFLGTHLLRLPPPVLEARPGLTRYKDKALVAGFRPEALSCLADGATGLPGRVALAEDLGATLLLHLDVEAPPPHLRADQVAEEAEEVIARQRSRARLRAVVDGRAPVKAGDRVAIEMDAERLHLFDPGTGIAIGG
jgi:multiple sugar transport system ATP-binding protein